MSLKQLADRHFIGSSNPKSCVRLAIMFCTWVLACALPVQAANKTWTSAVTGSWTDATKWTPGVAPIAGDSTTFDKAGTYTVNFSNVFLDLSDIFVTNGTVTFERVASPATLTIMNAGGGRDLTIGNATLNMGNTLPVNITAGDDTIINNGGTLAIKASSLLNTQDLFVNTGGTLSLVSGTVTSQSGYIEGTFNNSGGATNISSSIYLGNAAGTTGNYTLSSTGTLTVDGAQYIGYDGTGVFTQTGGTFSSPGQNLFLGYNAGSSGTYNLSAGTLNPHFQEMVGFSGTGTFIQTGGTHTVTGGFLAIGYNAGAVGSYTLSGGNLTTDTGTIVGSSGLGTFLQSAGTHSAGLGVVVDGPGSGGTYTFTGGTLNSTGGQDRLGISGTGTFDHSGGTHTLSAGVGLEIGRTASAHGIYNLSGTGALVANGDEYVGHTGTGNFNQSGGTNTINDNGNSVYVGYQAGSTGVYTLSGGALVSWRSEFIGYAGNGTFHHSGGTNTIIVNAGSFEVGSLANSTGTYNLSGTASLNAGRPEYIGNSGTGVFNQTGGTNSIAGSSSNSHLFIGGNSDGIGTYNLSGGSLSTLNDFGDESVGLSGTGFFNQSGGTNTVGRDLSLGRNALSSGVYTLSSGSLVVWKSEFIGYAGSGTFNHTGGTNSMLINGGFFEVGSSANSTGTYNLSGTGSLTSGRTEYIGNSGTGVFNQTAGTNAIIGGSTNCHLIIGGNAGGVGTYSLSGGNFSTVADLGDVTVGLSGTGYFIQSGGTNSVGRELSIGRNALSTGTYTLSGTGSLVVGADEYVGYSGVGIFNQSGGTHTINSGNSLFLGSLSGSSGTYTISGGSAIVSGNVSGGSSGGTAVLNVSGTGALTIGGTLAVYNTAGTIVNLSGGTINTTGLNFNGVPSLLNWTSGKLNLTTNVTFDSAAAGTTTSAAFGASLNMGTDRTLMITGNETLGGTGSFALTLNSGSSHHVTGSLTLSPTGTFTQNVGSTLYAATFTQAGGIVNGTLQNQGQFTYQSGQFNGRLLNQGTVSFGPFFTAGNGVENDAIVTLVAGQTLTVNGAGLDNLGTFTLSGGVISGSGAVVNNYGGALQGHGTINPAFTNNGVLDIDGVLRLNGASATNNGVVRGSGTVIGGFTNATGGTVDLVAGDLLAISNAWTNSGLVKLAGSAVLGGGTISNTGTIQGAGTINSPIANAGIIRASSGELDLGAAGNTNAAGGLIQAATGNTVMVLQGLATNAGTIALTGGAFDNNNHALSNAGIINGYGTLRTGGLTNTNKLNVGEGNLDVFGSVVNNGTIGIQGSRFAYFFDDVSGSGSYTGLGTATFLAALSPGNSPAVVSFGGNVSLTSSTTLNIELGGTAPAAQYDQIQVTGQLALGGTLVVSLINGFTPSAGQSFDILDFSVANLSGTFSSILLPMLTGSLTWNTTQLYTTGILSVSAPVVPGDFDSDGDVDGADFVAWQTHFPTATGATLADGDADGDGDVDGADFVVWQTNFPFTPGPGVAAVPEPGTALLGAFGCVSLVAFRRWRGYNLRI